MIDFTLSENDQKILEVVRERALVCREYARYYDEHEEEFAPDELPENAQFKDRNPYVLMRAAGENGMTLYTFKNDEEGVSNCNGGCAANWPRPNP